MSYFLKCYILNFSKAITKILTKKFNVDFRWDRAGLPKEFFEGERELLIAIVRAFLIDEGCIRDRNINFCSGTKELLEDLNQICTLLSYKCQAIRKSGGTYYLNLSPESFAKAYEDIISLGKLPNTDK